jgi:Ni,Fe-hydrogenase III large subunit
LDAIAAFEHLETGGLYLRGQPMTGTLFCTTRNVEAIPASDIPLVAIKEFRDSVIEEVSGGSRIVSFFAQPAGEATRLYAVLARDESGTLALLSTEVVSSYPSLTPDCPQAHWFEREIAEQWGMMPDGHPWLKPIRFHESYRAGGAVFGAPRNQIGDTDYFQVRGAEIHEVAVGPVHAGIIEPGHFRFQCHGENVYHLEISLGYQHRGIEPAMVRGPVKRRIHLVETAAGDTTVGHATAYCHAMEALSGCMVPARAAFLRGIALELERLANHTGDLGALAGDVGYLPSMSYCGRIRGDFLNMSALLCGSRFSRGFIRPGGIGFDIDENRIGELTERLNQAFKDVTVAVELMLNSPSVLARFEGTGAITSQMCRDLGIVGPVARACGERRDVRHDFPSGIFRFSQIPVSTWHTGDVFSRVLVRWLEIQRSIQFVRDQAIMIPGGASCAPVGDLKPGLITVSMMEGWRGEICHVAVTDQEGRLAHYKMVDPSFHNWFGLAIALRGQQISDFPLCNKSFNLSYCGHDL